MQLARAARKPAVTRSERERHPSDGRPLQELDAGAIPQGKTVRVRGYQTIRCPLVTLNVSGGQKSGAELR